MAIMRLTVQQAIEESRILYIPFDDGRGSASSRVVTMLNNSAVPGIIPDDELAMGSRSFDDPYTQINGYFTPLNDGAENGDNYEILRNATPGLDASWIQELLRLDTLEGVGQLIMGGHVYYKGDNGTSTQALMSCNDNDQGHAVEFNGGNKISAVVRTPFFGYSQLGTFTTMMANDASNESIPGLNGVSEYEFSYLVHWDMVTKQCVVYINSWPTLGYRLLGASFPDVNMVQGLGICCKSQGGTPTIPFNDGTTSVRNGVAQLYMMRVESESSSWVPSLALEHFRDFNFFSGLGV